MHQLKKINLPLFSPEGCVFSGNAEVLEKGIKMNKGPDLMPDVMWHLAGGRSGFQDGRLEAADGDTGRQAFHIPTL